MSDMEVSKFDELQPRSGWRINRGANCYERGSERRPMQIHPSADGYCVSAFGVRGFEAYPSFAEAEAVALREGCEPDGVSRAHADAAELKRQRKNAQRSMR